MWPFLPQLKHLTFLHTNMECPFRPHALHVGISRSLSLAVLNSGRGGGRLCPLSPDLSRFLFAGKNSSLRPPAFCAFSDRFFCPFRLAGLSCESLCGWSSPAKLCDFSGFPSGLLFAVKTIARAGCTVNSGAVTNWVRPIPFGWVWEVQLLPFARFSFSELDHCIPHIFDISIFPLHFVL